MSSYKHYRRTGMAEAIEWTPDFIGINNVSISPTDLRNGSPKLGDMIARNPANHDDKWLIAADYFTANFKQTNNTKET